MVEQEAQKKILIVDDEPEMLAVLEKVLYQNLECRIELATSGMAALQKLDQFKPDVLLTDIKMPDLDGLQLLKKTREIDPTITTIIMTGYGTIEMAVQAIKDGAYEFFEKPFDNNRIVRAVKRALEWTILIRENRQLQHRLSKDTSLDSMIGRSPRMMQTKDLLSRFAGSDATVLIRGQSGTGKEVAARTIHALSSRKSKKMVTVNCPALPEQILESELFGYKKGAFTGAETDKDGLFIEADGSTILLDEIGDIPISIQTKLLRVLQEKEIQPLGQTKSFKVDVRVIASTNQDLEAKMKSGDFREDLFYRLNVMSITLPSLDEIAEDIEKVRRSVHQTVHAVSSDLDKFHFNKAVARIRELTNALDGMNPDGTGASWVYRNGIETVVKLVGPIMPHIAEEMWQSLGHKNYVIETAWPGYDESLLVDDTVTVGVQVNGKMRGTVELPQDCDQASAEAMGLELDTVVKAIDGKEVRKVIYVPNRIINVVV